jgi:uncharacterized protein
MVEPTIGVEVVYAEVERQIAVRIELPRGSSARLAIDLSGIAGKLPEGAVDLQRLGVFGRRIEPEHILQDGDRLEIYRPLLLDPMEARRKRARWR